MMDDKRISGWGTGFQVGERAPSPKGEKEKGTVSFGDMLKDSIQKVNTLQMEAEAAVEDLALNRNPDVHSTMIAMEKAGLSFELMMQIRNRLVAAYEELMRMPV